MAGKFVWDVDVVIMREKKFKFDDIVAPDMFAASDEAVKRAWDESEFGFLTAKEKAHVIKTKKKEVK